MESNAQATTSVNITAQPNSSRNQVEVPLESAQERPGPPKLVSEATKYTVLVAFGLYTIGFLVWHSYLSRYGVSAVAFVQTDYVSAAFCYALVLITVALPPFVLYQWLATGHKHTTQDATIKILLGVWALLLVRLIPLFFSSGHNSSLRTISFRMGLYMAFTIVYVFTVLKWLLSPAASRLSRKDMGLIALNCGLVISLLFFSSLDVGFLMVTLSLYPLLSNITPVGSDTLREIWKSSGSLLKILVGTLVALIFVWHIQYFGRAAFGGIPREVGGGKPEVAFIRASPQHRELLSALGVGQTNMPGNSNALFGPVAILIRSEKEILFLNSADLDAPAYLTNVVTNLAFSVTTNMSTNRVTTYTTNTVTKMATNVVRNRIRPSARQIRSDLVEGMVFGE